MGAEQGQPGLHVVEGCAWRGARLLAGEGPMSPAWSTAGLLGRLYVGINPKLI